MLAIYFACCCKLLYFCLKVGSIPSIQNLPITSAPEINRKYPSEDIVCPKHLQFATDLARYNSFRSARPEFLPKGQPIHVLVEAGFFYVGESKIFFFKYSSPLPVNSNPSPNFVFFSLFVPYLINPTEYLYIGDSSGFDSI